MMPLWLVRRSNSLRKRSGDKNCLGGPGGMALDSSYASFWLLYTRFGRMAVCTFGKGLLRYGPDSKEGLPFECL